MKKNSLFCLIFLANLSFINAQKQEVNWVNIDNAEQTAATKGKKIMVKVYTNWCGWCKEMDKSTFPQEKVAKVLNENYVSVRFNAEQKEAINWGGTPYKLVSNGKSSYHELAAKWLNSNLTYPTIVILDEKGNIIQAIPGYRKPDEFEKILAYFAGDFHKKVDWGTFEKNYKSE
jgi:thioredoxin-related protein